MADAELLFLGLIARADGRGCLYWNAGNIPVRETVVNAVAQMANDWERRLLGLHCGQFLDRARHKVWAPRRIEGAHYIRRRGNPNVGICILTDNGDR